MTEMWHCSFLFFPSADQRQIWRHILLLLHVSLLFSLTVLSWMWKLLESLEPAEKVTVLKAADEEPKLVCFVTFELVVHKLSLLVAAELDEALQHSDRVVSKRHLEGGEPSETMVEEIFRLEIFLEIFHLSTTLWQHEIFAVQSLVSWTLTLSLVGALSFTDEFDFKTQRWTWKLLCSNYWLRQWW